MQETKKENTKVASIGSKTRIHNFCSGLAHHVLWIAGTGFINVSIIFRLFNEFFEQLSS